MKKKVQILGVHHPPEQAYDSIAGGMLGLLVYPELLQPLHAGGRVWTQERQETQPIGSKFKAFELVLAGSAPTLPGIPKGQSLVSPS